MSETRQSKQVLVVRKDLNMRKGKIAAQCAHASMKVLLDRMTRGTVWSSEPQMVGQIPVRKDFPIGDPPQIEEARRSQVRILSYQEKSALGEWLDGIFTKICVSVNSEAELLDLRGKAREAGLPEALIQDSGATEFHGVPTYTVLAIGPAWADEIDPITKHLPLL